MTQSELPPPRLDRRRPALIAAAVLLIGVVLAACVMWVTRRSIGLSPDSRSYVTAARFIAAGKGVMVYDGDGTPGLFTHLAPLLSLVLGALQHFGANVMKVSRWLNAGCLGLSVLLCGWLAYRASERSVWAAVLAPLLVFGCVSSVHLFCMLVSEPLFIALMLATLAGVAAAFWTGRWWWIAMAAVCAGGMGLTRYAGVAIVPAVGLGILCRWRGPLKQRLLLSAGFVAVGMLPVTYWIVHGARKTSRIGNRRMGWHPPGGMQWAEFGQMLASWAVPWNHIVGWIIGGIVLVAALVLVGVIELRRRRQALPPTPALDLRFLLWLVAGCYFAFILLSVSMFDAYTPLDDRIFLPLRVCLTLAVTGVLLKPNATCSRVGRIAVAAFCAIGVAQLAPIPGWMKTAAARDLGYASTVWQKSPTVKLSRKLPKTSVLYSNISDVIDLLGGRFCKPIPKTWNDNSGRPIPEIYARKLPGMWNDMKAHDGQLLYYRRSRRTSYVSEEKIRDDLHLVLVRKVTDGALYQLDPTFVGPPVVPLQYQLPPGAPQ